MPRPVGLQADIYSRIDKDPSTSCSEKGEVQSCSITAALEQNKRKVGSYIDILCLFTN